MTCPTIGSSKVSFVDLSLVDREATAVLFFIDPYLDARFINESVLIRSLKYERNRKPNTTNIFLLTKKLMTWCHLCRLCRSDFVPSEWVQPNRLEQFREGPIYMQHINCIYSLILALNSLLWTR